MIQTVTVAHESTQHRRTAILEGLAAEEPELDLLRRTAIAYFDARYGDQRIGNLSVRECIAEAWMIGERDRQPFTRQNNSHLKVHVHPECPSSPRVAKEMAWHTNFHQWEFNRCVCNIDLDDTDQAIQKAVAKWSTEYKEVFNRRNSLTDNHVTFTYAGAERDSTDFVYDRTRVLETIARTGMIHWEKLQQLFHLTRGINCKDEIEVNGAYMELCAAGASDSLIALWDLGLYVPFQNGKAQGWEVDADHEDVLHMMMQKMAMKRGARCTLGVVFDHLGAQIMGKKHEYSGHIFDPDITVALPAVDSVSIDLESFAAIKSDAKIVL